MIPYIMVEPKQWSEMIQAMEENARLKAEVERLRKAGDEVIQEWSSGDEKEARNFMKALVIWNAAKEGKQP
jgi:regulator of replication initiation timing